MRRSFKILTALIGLSACCGCHAAREHMRDTSLRYLAHRAYSLADRPGAHDPFPRDFRAGWEQAYYNVSIGLDPCPPSVPPECYWGTRFDTPAGRQRVDAWFRGYQYGAAAAVCDQRDQVNPLPTGPECERPRVCESENGPCACSQAEIFHLPPVHEECVDVP